MASTSRASSASLPAKPRPTSCSSSSRVEAGHLNSGVVLPPLRMSGIEVTVTPAAGPGGATRFELPRVDMGWRLGRRLREKANQARRSAARWLVVDSLDSRWQLSAASGADLHAIAATLAGEVRAALSGHSHVVGVVLTDGAVLLSPKGQTARL